MATDVQASTGDVFQDLGFTPGDAEKLRIKTKLMTAIETFITQRNLTQAQAADLMGVSRPRISDVVRCKSDKFPIDARLDMLAKAGFQVDVSTTAA